MCFAYIDILYLLIDSASSRESFNIISQGEISKILSKDKFISFLKYSHDHFGESIEDILSVIKPVEDLKLIQPEDIAIFKKQQDRSSSYREKQVSIKNYTIEDSSDFSEEFIRIYFQEYKKLN